MDHGDARNKEDLDDLVNLIRDGTDDFIIVIKYHKDIIVVVKDLKDSLVDVFIDKVYIDGSCELLDRRSTKKNLLTEHFL